MEKLIEKAKTTPQDLSNSDIAKVFLHLMEFPEEDFQTTDLINHMIKRESSRSYEIARALALYYSELNGDFFFVGEGDDYNKAYLRAIKYIHNAYEIRDKNNNKKLERYGEFEDSHIERDLASKFTSLLEHIYDLQEKIEFEFGKEDALYKKSIEFIKLYNKISKLDNSLELIYFIEKNHKSYFDFVKTTVKTLPQDD